MTVDSLQNLGSSLGELVAERPGRAQLFERLRLDYCCGGRQTLAEGCRKRGLELEAVCAALDGLDAKSHSVESTDWREIGTAELCGHIVAVHHNGLRETFPHTVARVHGGSDPRLRDVQRLFGELRGQLEPHLASEESELFPACLAYEQNGAPVDQRVLEEHESEHAALGHALVALRILCHDYDRQAAHCNTHHALVDALEAFEQDLHRHVHEENNILLPRARQPRPTPTSEARSPISLRQTTRVRPARSLPACCEGWIAEQTHSWAMHHRAR